jgi:hypothetical protein
MPTTIENQEIHRTFSSMDEVYNQRFYETQNARTTSSLDLFNEEQLFLNFKVEKTNRLKYLKKNLINVILSNESQIEKYKLPEHYSKNNLLISELYNTLKANKNIISEDIDRNVQLITDNISELEFKDIHLEITKTDLVKFTTIFDENKILIISKCASDTDNNIIYSYFINRQLIATDVADISIFIQKFKEYLCL